MVGVVYSHRNEDVVNMGARDASSSLIKSHETSSKCKREEFMLIAEFMGMRELEFSKWILSASTTVLEEVLQKYKKSKD